MQDFVIPDLMFQAEQVQTNKAAAVKKQQFDVVKLQILKFLQALSFAKPSAQRLSNDALKKFADSNERNLWPHRPAVSAKHKEPDSIIKALQEVYEENTAIEWSSNVKSRGGNYYVMKTMHSFSEFAIHLDEVQQGETEMDPPARTASFASLFPEAEPEADEVDGSQDDKDEVDDY